MRLPGDCDASHAGRRLFRPVQLCDNSCRGKPRGSPADHGRRHKQGHGRGTTAGNVSEAIVETEADPLLLVEPVGGEGVGGAQIQILVEAHDRVE